MRRAARTLCLPLLMSPAFIWGQTTAALNFNPTSATQGGVHLYGVSVYSAYYLSGSPASFEFPASNGFLPGSNAMTGIAVTIGGSKSGGKSKFRWSYSPSYFNLFYANNQFDNNGSLNHQLNLNWTRQLGGKWTLTAAANGFIANLEQLYFNPGVLSNAASIPVSFDELAAGILAGKFTDTQLAAVLTNSPLAASPQQGYLYGSRMFNAFASVGLSRSLSGRTSISITATGNRAQTVNGLGTIGGTPATYTGYVVPQMTSVGAVVVYSHSVSPRTQVSVQASSVRTFSRIQQGYASSGLATLGRAMSRRWFLQARAGAGKLTYSHETYNAPKSVQYLLGGGIGFKTYSQTFLASYDRFLGDLYGLGSGTTASAMGAWNWRKPGSGWALSANGGYQDLNNLTFGNTRSWVAGAGLARSLSRRVFVSIHYDYLQLPASMEIAGAEISRNGVSVGLTWSPSQLR